jgi:cytochrome c peroxidase
MPLLLMGAICSDFQQTQKVSRAYFPSRGRRHRVPDQRGYVANPEGSGFVDTGVGGFLDGAHALSGQPNPNPEWQPRAAKFKGKFQVPTLRNVDKRPYAGFVKAYTHNGYFKRLKEIVAFLQHAGCPAALRAERSWREDLVLACA